jgi:hypothetical protein
MKLTVTQLRRIIKEELESVLHEVGVTGEEFMGILDEPTIGDLPVIESFSRRRLNEMTYEEFRLIDALAGLAVSAGVAGLVSVKILGSKVYNKILDRREQNAAKGRQKAIDDAMAPLVNDEKLAGMLEQLAQLKKTGTSTEVRTMSKWITDYIKENMSPTGADPMDVRKALTRR